MTTKFNDFACCRDMEERRLSSPGCAVGCIRAAVGEAPIIPATTTLIAADQPSHPRSIAKGWHEAGHGVAAIALGGSCSGASLEVHAHATTQITDNLTGRLMILLAGRIAEDWCDGKKVRHPPDDEVAVYLDRVRRQAGGGCDMCRVLHLVDVITCQPGDISPLVMYRTVEKLTLVLMSRPDITATVRIIADRLMQDGTISGVEITDICKRQRVVAICTVPEWRQLGEHLDKI